MRWMRRSPGWQPRWRALSTLELDRLEELRALKVAEVTGRPIWRPHPHQIPPPKPWHLWLMLGGRGCGKTDGCAAYFDRFMRQHPGARGSIIAPTLGDAVEACVNGPSGLKAHNPSVRMIGGPGGQHVYWPNGSEAKLFGASSPEDVDRLRAGGNRHINWWEELAAWRYLDDCVDHAEFGLRLGSDPHVIASTTPKPRKRLRELMTDPTTILVRARTLDNAAHIPEAQLQAWIKKYSGTRLGRQELEGELLDEAQGALWHYELFQYAEAPKDLDRVVVAVDPSGARDPDSGNDAIGIVVCGFDAYTQKGHVLADYSLTDGPAVWAAKAVYAYHYHSADLIVAEANFGGAMVESVIKTADRRVPVRMIHASRGKAVRAQPVSMLYEQARVFHDHPMPELEDQLTTWVPGESDWSPDRLDALVWGLTELMLGGREAKVLSGRRYAEEPVYRKGDLEFRGERFFDEAPER